MSGAERPARRKAAKPTVRAPKTAPLATPPVHEDDIAERIDAALTVLEERIKQREAELERRFMNSLQKLRRNLEARLDAVGNAQSTAAPAAPASDGDVSAAGSTPAVPPVDLESRISESIRVGFDELRRNLKNYIARGRTDFGQLDYPRASILMRLGSTWSPIRLGSCEKEPMTIDWIETSVKVPGVLFDIGANVGAYSLVAAMAPDSETQVVAFEPAPATYAVLAENVGANRVEEKVLALPIALSSHTGRLSLRLRDGEAGASGHAIDDGSAEPGSPLVHVPCYTLDDAIAILGLPEPDRIKIDVDGLELDVLTGASGTLAKGTVQTILIEVHGANARVVRERLGAFGYVPSRKSTRRIWHGEPVDHWYVEYIPGTPKSVPPIAEVATAATTSAAPGVGSDGELAPPKASASRPAVKRTPKRPSRSSSATASAEPL